MTGINVLSATQKGGDKLKKTSTLKGKGVSVSPENAVAAFATMLSGSMNLPNTKGQNSSIAGQQKEMLSGDQLVQGVQNPNIQGSILGTGRVALSFLTQMLQSELPAGKEANSGNVVSQGTQGLANTNLSGTNAPSGAAGQQILALLNLISQASNGVSTATGMASQKPQGDTPGADLDQYRQVIANLLEVLSGEITVSSPQGNTLSSKNTGPKNLSQDMAKIVQGWKTVTEDGAKGDQVSTSQQGIQALLDVLNSAKSSGNSDLAEKVTTLLTALSPKLSTGLADEPPPQGLMTSQQDKGDTKTTNLNPIVGQIKDISTSQQGIQALLDVLNSAKSSGNSDLTAKITTLLTALSPKLSTGLADETPPQGLMTSQQDKGDTKTTNAQQKSNAIDLSDNTLAKTGSGALDKGIHKGNSTDSAVSSVKTAQDQSATTVVGLASKLAVPDVANGKAVASPVWEQISNVFHQQVTSSNQELKEFSIQLNPADLGKIQIGMRWENGQVHLMVQASDAATGQVLQNHLPDLRQALSNQGVNCGMLQMGLGGKQQQNSQGKAPQKSSSQAEQLNEDENLISVGTSTINPLDPAQEGNNRINIMA